MDILDFLSSFFSGLGTQNPAHYLAAPDGRLPFPARTTGIALAGLAAVILSLLGGTFASVHMHPRGATLLLLLGALCGLGDGLLSVVDPLYAQRVTNEHRFWSGALLGGALTLLTLPWWNIARGSRDNTPSIFTDLEGAFGLVLFASVSLLLLRWSVALSALPVALLSASSVVAAGAMGVFLLVSNSPMTRLPLLIRVVFCLLLTLLLIARLRY